MKRKKRGPLPGDWLAMPEDEQAADDHIAAASEQIRLRWSATERRRRNKRPNPEPELMQYWFSDIRK